uniref:Uncharacterized protein n=1 Tax=Panagrolaimus sp. PS1159 TaxID=55785 RepID=A0AC35F565_9BILA
MRTRNQTCCCLPIKACASIIAILCIFSEIGSVGFGFINFLWWIAPMSIVFITFYILVIIGICTERSNLLIPAEIFLGIKIVFTFLLSFILFISSRHIPENIVEKYKNFPMFHEITNLVQHFFFAFALSVFIYLCFEIYSFFVIRKARKWLIENAKTLTHPIPISESIEVIVYSNYPHNQHPHQQQHYFQEPLNDLFPRQRQIYYVNPTFQRNSISDISVAPPGYNDDISWNNGQQSAMSQSQLQRIYNTPLSTTAEMHPNRTYQNIYPTLPSAPPQSP